MKKILISMLLFAMVYSAMAQNGYESVLQEIETNSTTLSALRNQIEADKLNNRTGIYLPNPEVEFNYLWGSPTAIGDRKDFNVTQSFDFPTAYRHRGKIASLSNDNLELRYKAERINLLLTAKQACIELVYYNALGEECEERLHNAQRIATSYKTRLDKGEANILEYNKAQLNLSAVENEVARIHIERTNLQEELKRLNGGKAILFPTKEYTAISLPLSFNEWYTVAETKSPALQYVSGEIEVNKQQIKLNRALGLPKFTAGYMSEKVLNERFQGVTVGISIPLWENKNRVKQAKAQVQASQAMLEDTKVQFYTQLNNLYLKAVGLQENAVRYRKAITKYNNAQMLSKALEAGEISLLEYLLEMDLLHEAIHDMLAAERDFHLTVAELSAVEL